MAQKYAIVKKPLKQRIGDWANEHIVEIGVWSAAIVGVIGGVAWGYGMGSATGYSQGMDAYREWHVNIAKTILDEAAHEGAFTALKYVRDDSKVYDQLLKDPDSVISKVSEKFYESDYAKSMLEVLAK